MSWCTRCGKQYEQRTDLRPNICYECERFVTIETIRPTKKEQTTMLYSYIKLIEGEIEKKEKEIEKYKREINDTRFTISNLLEV